MLVFSCYFVEPVESSCEESERQRRCRLFFYLEDDTLCLVEPKVKNSGLAQGTLVRRHQVPYTEIQEERDQLRTVNTKFVTMWDLNVGQDLAVYGKRLRLTNCDKFTRDFLESHGVTVSKEEPLPSDDYDLLRSARQEMRPLKPYKRINTLSQYLDNDRQVLRFYCQWNDGKDKRKLVLLYYLADDTIQVRKNTDLLNMLT